MTGEKNRGATLEKLWKLDDKLLTTPKHDELVLGITQQYILKTFPALITDFLKDPINWRWGYEREIKSDVELKTHAFDRLSKSYPNVRFSYNDSLVDYSSGRSLDLEIEKKYRCEFETAIEDCRKISASNVSHYNEFVKNICELDFETVPRVLKIEHEVPIKQAHNGFIIGYWDCIVSFNVGYTIKINVLDNKMVETSLYERNYPKFYIEAKPYIDSYGAVVRQIQTYKNFMPHEGRNVVCLLTPDSTFNEAFESQDIVVISP